MLSIRGGREKEGRDRCTRSFNGVATSLLLSICVRVKKKCKCTVCDQTGVHVSP